MNCFPGGEAVTNPHKLQDQKKNCNHWDHTFGIKACNKNSDEIFC